MIKHVFLALIQFYQRFLSPIKGFNCAHHRLHKGDTCSNAIKKIILDNPIKDIPRLSKARFKECKNASIQLAAKQSRSLERADLPCDPGCFSDVVCSGDSSTDCSKNDGSCSLPCDVCLEFTQLKRRTKIILLSITTFILLAFLYYYGSQITKLDVTQLPASQRSDGILKRLVTRSAPSLRAKVTTSSATHYSNIIDSNTLNDFDKGSTVELVFKKPISTNYLLNLELQDARFSATNNIVIVGQTIETVDQPELRGNGKRFKYEFKSRWGF